MILSLNNKSTLKMNQIHITEICLTLRTEEEKHTQLHSQCHQEGVGLQPQTPLEL